MNIEEVRNFLGLPAQNKEFDQYLTAHGISHRPVFKETPVDRISVKNLGISLVFDTAALYEEMYGPLREAGSMIFSSLQIYGADNDSGFEQYPGALPYGLSFKTSFSEAKKLLGEPTINNSIGDDIGYVWYNYRGDTIGITFLPENAGISWLEISKAEKEPPEQMDWD